MATTKTELYNNGTLVATKTSAPFNTFDWTPASGEVGSASLTVKRYEDGVLVATSAAVGGTVDAASSTEYVDWTGEISSVDQGSGTLASNVSNSGIYNIGAKGTKATNGDNTIKFNYPAFATGDTAQGLGLTNTYAGIGADTYDMDIFALVNTATSLRKLYIYEDKVEKFNVTITDGDLIELKVEGSTVKILRNSTVVYTSAKTFTLPLNPVGLFYKQAAYAQCKVINAEWANSANLIAATI
jgi:hypothetical protein